MATDPMLSILSGVPGAADYDAAHAAMTASERGRWFLGEYARRNRHADTQTLVSAIARVEAAIRGEAAAPDANTIEHHLVDIVAAIARVESVLAAGLEAAAGSDSGALERIADIAFVLHEREVERSLCDALDAAVREMGGMCAQHQVQIEILRKAADLLRALSTRVREIAARTVPERPPQSPAHLPLSESPSGVAQHARVGGEPPSLDAESARPPAPIIESEGDAFLRVAPTHQVSSAESSLDRESPRRDDARSQPAATDAAMAPQADAAVNPSPSDDPLADLRALSEEEMIALFS